MQTSAYLRLNDGTLKCPIQKCGFFMLDKAAQGFAVRRTQCTPQQKARGERRTTQIRPFMDGHKLDLAAGGKALMDGIERQTDLHGITHNLTGDADFLNDFLEGIMGAGPNG